ncbi:MAG: hypothetical protein H0W50_01575 [Parachlamydiaceae bacterium]|nr:hypothetical protein [Parachlamydiaceae bacterium]
MKHLYLLSFFILIFALSAFLSADYPNLLGLENDDKYLSKAENLVNQILTETALEVESLDKIKVSGEMVSMPGGIVKTMGLSFNSYEKLSKEEIRKKTVQLAEKLLQNINSNKEIPPFLAKSPFTINEIEISIYNHDQQGNWPYDPEIGNAHFNRGKITYSTYDPDKKFGNKNEFVESYEEALLIVQNGSQSQKEKAD